MADHEPTSDPPTDHTPEAAVPDPYTATTPDALADDPVRRRRRPDGFTLVTGLVCLTAAVLAFVGWMPGPPDFDPRWALAGGAVLVGLVLLLASLRRPRRGR